MNLQHRNGDTSLVDDDFEVLTPTEVNAETAAEVITETISDQKVRKLCACGCGETVTGNRALKRGHQMGDGLPASIFSGNDILVFQAGFVMLVGAISAAIENKTKFPRMESEEQTAVGEPLGRIAARHIPKTLLRRMKPGDAADSIAVITVMCAYIIRATTVEKKEVPPVATNGQYNDQTVSGLGQYSYRNPAQNVQSQNDRTN
jgi:hypothetical protein